MLKFIKNIKWLFILALYIVSAQNTYALCIGAGFDTEACGVSTSVPPAITQPSNMLMFLGPQWFMLSQMQANQQNGQLDNGWVSASPLSNPVTYPDICNDEAETRCHNLNIASYCNEANADLVLTKYYNKNINGAFGTGILQANWDPYGTYTCPPVAVTEDQTTTTPPPTVPFLGFNQAMTTAQSSMGLAGEHISDNNQFDPNGVQEAQAVEAFNSKESAKSQDAKKETGAITTNRKIASGTGGSSTGSNVPGLRSGSTDPTAIEPEITDQAKAAEDAGKYGQAGAGAGKGSAGQEGGWSSANSLAAQAGGNELKFGGDTPSNVNPNGSEDPANYFALTGIDENIFKKVEKRYRETTNHWSRVDLTRDSSSIRDRALAAAKDPNSTKSK